MLKSNVRCVTIFAFYHPYLPELVTPEKSECEKIDSWIKHYIDLNSNDEKKMGCIFEALSNSPVEKRIQYIIYFLNDNDRFESFKKLPLTPLFLSWSGSAVPLYSSWLDYLKMLLPNLNSLKFLEHKKYIEERIKSLEQQIIETEIDDILEG